METTDLEMAVAKKAEKRKQLTDSTDPMAAVGIVAVPAKIVGAQMIPTNRRH
jgi:hypothetical protein